MEFVVVTHHEKANSCTTGLKDMTILSIPDVLLVYTGCENKTEFTKSIVTISFSFDYMPQLTEHKYCSVNGTMVFRHLSTFRSAIFSLVSEKILLDSGEMYCINKISNIAWQDNDRLCEFLGTLEAKIRLSLVKHSEVTRNDIKCHAIAIADAVMSDCVRDSLKFLRCEFGVNVVYKEEDGTRTRRSILFPVNLLNTEKIVHDGIYSIISLKPNITYVLASPLHKTVFGVIHNDEDRVDFEAFISQYHTAREMQRIKLEVIPIMTSMQPGDVVTSTIEFATPKGLLLFDVTMRNIGRSCMVVTFSEVNGSEVVRV